MKGKSEPEMRNQTRMQLYYSQKFHDYTKKIEEGDKKQKQFQVPFFIFHCNLL